MTDEFKKEYEGFVDSQTRYRESKVCFIQRLLNKYVCFFSPSILNQKALDSPSVASGNLMHTFDWMAMPIL